MNTEKFSEALCKELIGNILPFWLSVPVDEANGGFHGAIDNHLNIQSDVPRSAILTARILWTFSAAYRLFGTQAYLEMAEYAFEYLTSVFWDQTYGGLYWSVDKNGAPAFARKHHYAQAFGIYGLTEFFRVTQEPKSLEMAKELFGLLEKYGYEEAHGGYIEGSSRNWGRLDDMRLSSKEINCRKSMNTMLHILEAYTNLRRVWQDDELDKKHQEIIEIFLDQIIDPQTQHFKLFFDDQWQSLLPHISFGHDIEGSWLLQEAAEIHGDEALLEKVRTTALRMAEAVYREGRDEDGSLFYEADPQGVCDSNKAWWVQAEAMVGFYNAYKLSGRGYFEEAAQACWTYIQDHLVDRKHGGWYKQRQPGGQVDHDVYKAGPWECPYHHSRACMELLARFGYTKLTQRGLEPQE